MVVDDRHAPAFGSTEPRCVDREQNERSTFALRRTRRLIAVRTAIERTVVHGSV
jgi:hypothetical protein